MLDDSGSMCGSPWKSLQQATNAFLTSLAGSKAAASSKVSCIIYNCNARVAFENESPSLKLQDKIKYVGGSTNYCAALTTAIRICGNTQNQSEKLVFYFMSDGMPHDFPTVQVNALKKMSYFSKIQFFACGFGRSNFSELKRVANLFPGGQMT